MPVNADPIAWAAVLNALTTALATFAALSRWRWAEPSAAFCASASSCSRAAAIFFVVALRDLDHQVHVCAEIPASASDFARSSRTDSASPSRSMAAIWASIFSRWSFTVLAYSRSMSALTAARLRASGPPGP